MKKLVVSLEGFTDPFDVANISIGKDDVTFIDQNDENGSVSLESFSNEDVRIKRVIRMDSSSPDSIFNVSVEAACALIKGQADDIVVINDTRKGFDYSDTVEGREFMKQLGNESTVVDNVHEAKALLI